MPPRHPDTNFFKMSLFWEVDIVSARISQSISSRCRHASPTPFFATVIIVGWRHYASASTQPLFLQDATTPPLHHFLFVIIVGRRYYASASTQPQYFFRVPPCHPYTKNIFLNLSLLLEGDIMLLLRLSHGISSGCHHATPSPFFGIVIVSGSLALCFCFDLDKVFLHGATTTPLHQFFLELSLFQEVWHYASASTQTRYFFRVPPLHQNIFGIVIILGKRTLCFCFDLVKVFLQGATMPTLHPKKFFLNFSLLLEGDIMLLLRLSQGISSGCHHATHKPFFVFVIIAGRGIMFCFDLAKVFLPGATMPPLHPLFSCHCGKAALCFCFNLAKIFLQDATMSPLYPPFFLIFHPIIISFYLQ